MNFCWIQHAKRMMPLYEYKCESCGRREEKLQKHGAHPPVCETCKYEMKLEGDGWAKDNYGLKNSKK